MRQWPAKERFEENCGNSNAGRCSARTKHYRATHAHTDVGSHAQSQTCTRRGIRVGECTDTKAHLQSSRHKTAGTHQDGGAVLCESELQGVNGNVSRARHPASLDRRSYMGLNSKARRVQVPKLAFLHMPTSA